MDTDNISYTDEEILKAWDEGKTIEFFGPLTHEWVEMKDNDRFYFTARKYRIAPKDSHYKNRWKPEIGMNYYSVDTYNEVIRNVWNNDEQDIKAYEIGNCFKTSAEAYDARKRVKDAYFNNLPTKMKKIQRQNIQLKNKLNEVESKLKDLTYTPPREWY